MKSKKKKYLLYIVRYKTSQMIVKIIIYANKIEVIERLVTCINIIALFVLPILFTFLVFFVKYSTEIQSSILV